MALSCFGGRVGARFFSGGGSIANSIRTPLFDWHKEQRGTVVDFCGYALPVLYQGLTIFQSVLHTRKETSLFDVSHMGQVLVTGQNRVEFLESLTPANVRDLKPGRLVLTQLTSPKGGILDDTIIGNRGDFISMVVNAACKVADMKYMNEHASQWRAKGKDINLELIEDRALIAIQGPKAARVFQKFTDADLSRQPFMSVFESTVCGIPNVVATRSGYTGEDGFEVSVPAKEAIRVANELMQEPGVQPAGLGARDSLRLEAGLCLMGSDMDDTTSPVEAGLNFTIPKRRRQEGGFPGDDVILGHLRKGVKRLRVGLWVTGAPAREHAPVVDAMGNKIGMVTSGGYSPTLKRNISMGYVPIELSKPGTSVLVQVRGRNQKAVVTKMPFVPTRYFRVGQKKQ